MKKTVLYISLVAIAALFIATLFFVYDSSKESPMVYETDSTFVTDIILKSVASGSIDPRKEIEAKPSVSGIIDKLFVEPGTYVTVGTVIARIKIIPSMSNLNSAQLRLNNAKIEHENQRLLYEKYKQLYKDKLISEVEYNNYSVAYNRAKQELSAAEDNLQIIKEGATKKMGDASNNIVKATSAGMVLDVPVEEGSFVIESNNFNDGTTIATIANMKDMIFVGFVDEAEVGKISKGMPIKLDIGALDGRAVNAILEYISPKGIDDGGAIQFEIKAAVKIPDSLFIRSGFSANANIVLDSRKKVLAVNEKVLQFDAKGNTFVEIETDRPQVFKKQIITTGLSDGINIEVLSGLNGGESMKILDNLVEAVADKPRGRKH